MSVKPNLCFLQKRNWVASIARCHVGGEAVLDRWEFGQVWELRRGSHAAHHVGIISAWKPSRIHDVHAATETAATATSSPSPSGTSYGQERSRIINIFQSGFFDLRCSISNSLELKTLVTYLRVWKRLCNCSRCTTYFIKLYSASVLFLTMFINPTKLLKQV